MTAWIVRAGRGGIRAAEWLENGYIAIYWDLGGADIAGLDREQLKILYREHFPNATRQVVASNVGMIYRFANEMSIGSAVVMYDPSTRLYHLGKIAGPCEYIEPQDGDDNGFYRHVVDWETEVSRDSLSVKTKHSLGSISTLFMISDTAFAEMLNISKGIFPAMDANDDEGEDESVDDSREATAEDGIERIKDRILQMEWDDIELLAAGALRSMGYKTSMTKRGADGGRDIIASPDGLGLESPRIIVEVKHRKEAIGAPLLRSFIGGLRNTDSGLYISTGGFTKDALYEADRAVMPVKLLDLDQFVRLIVDNYDNADTEMRAILPLVRIYWPA